MRSLFFIIFLASSAFSSNYLDHSLQKRKTIRAAHSMEIMGKKYYLKSGLTRYRGTNKKFLHLFEQTLRKRLGKKQEQFFEETHKALLDAAGLYEFDPFFLMAVINTESSFRVMAKGGAKEIGLMQLMPKTARWLAKLNKLEIKKAEDYFKPQINIALGAYYIHLLREKFKEDGRYYIAAYNMGPGNVQKKIRKKEKPKVYIGKVMQHYLAFYKNIKKTKLKQSDS
ncbi:lytic transglycosylase domain-containing protein [Bacteriovoracaceae bacterium]|nr:lytic transglycosylase domain-containing protein [Bacteriovoracaceae bacterium]